jgi:YD repeat-containing protein
MIMRRNIILLIIFLVISSTALRGQSPSNLKTDNLSGNVKTVRTEQTWMEKNVESKRVLMTIETYDVEGNKTQWDAYKGSEKPLRAIFTYDEKGKVRNDEWYNSADDLVAKTTYKYDGKKRLVEERTSNGIQILYSYDSRGNRILKRSFDLATIEGGRMFGDVNRTVRYSYDKSNNLIQVASFKPSGSRVWNPELQAHRIVYSHDSKGRTRSQTVFNANNSIRTKTEFAYDAQDRVVEESVFVGKTRILTIYKYGYECDARGNWIKQVKTKQVNDHPKPKFVVAETIYRTIDYRN